MEKREIGKLPDNSEILLHDAADIRGKAFKTTAGKLCVLGYGNNLINVPEGYDNRIKGSLLILAFSLPSSAFELARDALQEL